MQYLKEFLDEKVSLYNGTDFIELDPISIPHQFTTKEDIEIAGFFAATIAWGNRKAILKSGNQLMHWFDNAPYDFIINHTERDLAPFYKFTYRTFNGNDCVSFIKSLRHIYTNYEGIEQVFTDGYIERFAIMDAITNFRHYFLEKTTETHVFKHVANPLSGSAAKRFHMYLRWMVRSDNRGVDFGLWQNIKPADLMIPLDLHSGNIARKLQLLDRKSNDWRAVVELTDNLKKFDAADPVKYDFALFGLGVNNDF